ncbi:MAG TPA: hypothetical protein VNF27_09345 [Candidatus Binataceae bacterium]|nr:hypothetical protein [Candidatus Binataceae bacterium]
METQVQHLTARGTCSVCLQERTPTPARVFVVVGEEEGDPAVMGFCYKHAASTVGHLKALARRAPDAKFAPLADCNVIPLRRRF